MSGVGAILPHLTSNAALNFLAKHLLRYALLAGLIVILGGSAERRRDSQMAKTPEQRRAAMRRMIHIRFVLSGVVFAGSWVSRAHEPAWQRALTTAVVLLVVSPLLRILLRFLAAKRGQPARRRPSMLILMGARVVLILIAFGVQRVLEVSLTVENSAVIVAIGMGLVIAIGGPYTYWYALGRQMRTATGNPDDAVDS